MESNHVKDMIIKLKCRRETFSVNLSYPILPLFLAFWSDDFDPNRSIKSNRQSVWIQTCSVKIVSDDGQLLSSTYPIAVSTKEMDHDEAHDVLYQDLKRLSSQEFLLMYSRYHRSFVYVHADVYCYKMDQPEHRKNLKLLAGNSNVHGRFGYLTNVKQLVGCIRSCDECSKSIICEMTETDPKCLWRKGDCGKCTSWMYNIQSELLEYKPDDDFPREYCKKMGK
jgi:hypothetical protein